MAHRHRPADNIVAAHIGREIIMYVVTLPTGIRVTLSACEYRLTASWSSEERALSGLPADVIAVAAVAPSLNPDGTTSYPVEVTAASDTAGAAARRAKVIPGLKAAALLAIEAIMSSTPSEPLVIAVKGTQPAGRSRPASVCSPTSNNDEIAKSMVAVAAQLAQDVQDVFTAYAAKWALSEKRRAGIAAKLQPLGAVVV